MLQDMVVEFLVPAADHPAPPGESHQALVNLLAECPCTGQQHPCLRCALAARAHWAEAESVASRDALQVRTAQATAFSMGATCRTWDDLLR